jgi:hypothetical protein
LSAATEQIEVLRQQVAVYADDFANRDRIEAEAEEENTALGEQVRGSIVTGHRVDVSAIVHHPRDRGLDYRRGLIHGTSLTE